MTVGRYGRNNLTLVTYDLYGDAIGATTQVLFIMAGNQFITPVTWNPVIPRAAQALRIAVETQCATDTNPGNWTARLRRNDSGADTATASIPITTSKTRTVVDWSTQALFQAGDNWFILADGASKDTVIIRAILEWRVL